MVLGVTPKSPGYKEVDIWPLTADLEWAEGAVPTPHGSVAVAWQLFGPQECLLKADIPAGVTATVTFPVAGVVVRQLSPAEEGTEDIAVDRVVSATGPTVIYLATVNAPTQFTF